MDITIAIQLLAAGLIGAAGAGAISEWNSSKKIQAIVRRHNEEAEVWRKRDSEEEATKNLCLMLSNTFSTKESVVGLKASLESIKNASDALGHIQSYRKEISPTSLHMLVSYMKDEQQRRKSS